MAAANTVLINIEANTKQFHEAVNKLYTSSNIFTKKGLKAIINAEIKVSDKELKQQAEKARQLFEKALNSTKGIEYGRGKSKSIIGSYDLNGLKKAFDYLSSIKNKTEQQVKAFDKVSAAMSAFKKMSDVYTSINRYNNAIFSGKVAAARENSLKDSKRETREYARLQKEIAYYVKARDRMMNSVVYGNGNTNSTLAGMRRYYTEQAKQSERAARNSEKQVEIIRKNNAQYERQHGLMKGLVGMMSRYVSIYSIARFAQNIADVTGYFEKQKVALEGILGTASDAQKVLNDIKDFALKSPFQTKELVGFTKQLSAFGVSTDELFPTVKKLADLSAGLGVDMGRIILAYGQVKSAAVLRGQELRQFTEAGIPLVQKLADKFTELRGEVVTTADVFELISKRQVSFQMVADVLSDMTSEGGAFYKMQENITDTLYGQIQKLKDMWTLAMDDIGNGARDIFMKVVKFLQFALQNTRGLVSGLFTAAIITKGVSLVQSFRLEWDRLDASIRKAYVTQKNFFKERALINLKNLGWGALAAVVGYAVGAIIQHFKKLHEAEKKLKETADSFDQETNKMIRGFNDLAKRLQASTPNTKAYNDAIETLKSNYGEFINIEDELIKTMKEANDGTQEATDRYNELNEAVSAAIRLKQEYNKVMAQKQQASDIVVDNSKGSKFWGNGYDAMASGGLDYMGNLLASGQSEKVKGEMLNKLFGTKYNSNVVANLQKDLNTIIEKTYSDFTNKGLTDTASLQDIFKENFQNQFIGNQFGKTKNESIDTWVANFGRGLYEKLTQSNGWKEYVQTSAKASGEGTDLVSMLIRINEIFGKFNPGANTGKDTLGMYEWSQNERIKLLQEVVQQELSQLGDAELLKSVIGNNVGDNFKPSSVKEVLDAIQQFAESIGDPSRKAVIEEVFNSFKNGTDALTSQEAKIAEAMTAIHTWDGQKINGVELDKWFQNWNPALLGEQTVQQTRDKLASEYSELKKELDTYASKNSPLFQDDIAIAKTKMSMIELLAGADIYNVDLTDKKKSGGGSSKGGYRRLFADMFNLIKEAKEQQKRLVEGADGYTNALISDISKLENGPLKSFYSGINGNPFKKFLDNIKEYGLESEIFKTRDFEELSNKYKNNIGKDNISIADYQTIWNDLIAVVQNKAKSLEGKKGYESTVDTLLAYARQMVEEGEKIFGRDEIAKLIEQELQSLTRIQNAVEIGNQRYETFNELIGNGNFRDIYAALNNGENYKERDYVSIITQELIDMFSAEGGKGMSSELKSFESILKGSQLSLSSIPYLLDVINKISSIGKLEGLEGDELKEVKDKFIDAINKLVSAIKETYKSIQDTRTRNEKKEDKISDYQKEYYDRLDAINKAQKGIQEIKDKEGNIIQQSIAPISDAEAESRTFEALQDYTKNIVTELGGTYSDVIANITQGATQTGSSNFGNFMQLLNGFQQGGIQGGAGNLMQMAGAGAGAAAGFSGAIAIVDAIVKAIYGAINAILDMAEHTLKLMESQDSKSITVNTDGSVVVNGRYDDVNFEKTRKSLELIGTFNQHAMDGWEKAKSGDGLGALAEIYNSIVDLIADVNTIIDMDKQQRIEDIEDDIENQGRIQAKIEFDSGFYAGMEQLDKSMEKLKSLKQEEEDYNRMIELEQSKKKGDADKLKEWQDAQIEKQREQLNLIKEMKEELVGTADELSSTLADALIGAFREGTNAARAWRDSVKEYMQEIVQQMLFDKVFAPQIEDIIDKWVYGTNDVRDKDGKIVQTAEEAFRAKGGNASTMKKNLTDEQKAKEAEKLLTKLGDEEIDYFNNLSSYFQNLLKYKSSETALSGGIESITEDTARRLEALMNSQLGESVLTRQYVESMAANIPAHLRDMVASAKRIEQLTTSINGMMEGSVLGTRPFKVSMV